MPIPTPFHERTSKLCTSLFWKEWAGCHAVRSYDTTHEREYFALRHAAGLIDVSPLHKYEVYGPDAAALLGEVMVRDPGKFKIGRVAYLCWCDDEGKVLDDGTVSRLGPDRFRVTAAEPSGAWLARHARNRAVTIEDSTEAIGALALQGPTSREILRQLCGDEIDKLRFFRVTDSSIDGVPVQVSRTGYTGDLGFEIWVGRDQALRVWDAIMAEGRAYRIEPAGLDALDVTRVEAGFVMNGVDYFSANHCLIESRKSTPFELGLGWTVKLDRGPFVGQQALLKEVELGSEWGFVGLEIEWDGLERLYDLEGLPPSMPSQAWRTPTPVFCANGRQIGQATSGAWSPTLKKNLALATIEAEYVETGKRLMIDWMVEYRRHRVDATVVELPFYDPERKKS